VSWEVFRAFDGRDIMKTDDVRETVTT